MKAASFLKKNNQTEPVYTFSELIPEFAFEFYSTQPVYLIKQSELYTLKENIRVFAPKIKIDSLRNEGFMIQDTLTFPHFHISKLNGTLLTAVPGPRQLTLRCSPPFCLKGFDFRAQHK